jgi:uridine phosphorylase
MKNSIDSGEMLFSAQDMQNWRWQNGRKPGIEPPRTAILCLQPELMRRAWRRYPLKRVKGLFGDCYILNNRLGKVIVAGRFGMGAPAMAVCVEEYFALGVRQFVSIGVAGTLQPHLQTGDVILCDSALRGEGTSNHYLLPARSIAANAEWVKRIQSFLAAGKIPFHQGATWTTDAPYRESRWEAEANRQAGVLSVDMETSALFAATRCLGAQAASVLVVADRLLPDAWEPPSDDRSLEKNLATVLYTLVPWLAGLERTAENLL